MFREIILILWLLNAPSGGAEFKNNIEDNKERSPLFAQYGPYGFQNQLYPIAGPAYAPYRGDARPACAMPETNYCLYDNSYPLQKILTIIEDFKVDISYKYKELYHFPWEELLLHDNMTHSYRHLGHFVCESDVQYVRPGWAKNMHGQWVTVVNTETYPQSVRTETCRNGGRSCEFIPPCFKSVCKQRYTYVKLLTVDPSRPNKPPAVDVFEVPSACSCFIPRQI